MKTINKMAPQEDQVEKDIFEKISKNDIVGVKALLSQGEVKADFYDEHGMTPLQHAAYKGNKEMVQILLDQGADVNSGKHEHGYTALHFAALSGNVDICQILLNGGAKMHVTNSVGRTPSQMAAFVGNHSCVAVINNFVPRADVEYYTSVIGLETEPQLPPHLLEPFHSFIMQVNLHPVRVSLNLVRSQSLYDNLDKVKNVLELMSKREMRRNLETNEIMAFKFHYLSCVVAEIIRCKKLQNTQQETKKKEDSKEEETSKKAPEPVETLIKKLLKTNKSSNAEYQEQFLRECVRQFPSRECTVLRQMVGTLARSDAPSALQVIATAVNGQRGFADSDTLICCTCGEEKCSKKCSKCKAVQYCDRECQRLHWFLHKKTCCRASPGAAQGSLEAGKAEAVAEATRALKAELNLA